MVYDNLLYPVKDFKLCGNRLQIKDERGYIYGVYGFTADQLRELQKQITESLRSCLNMSLDKVFFFAEKEEHRDRVKYIDVSGRDETSGLSICGACFAGMTNDEREKLKYEDVVTFLTEEEFNAIVEFDKAIDDLCYSNSRKEKPELHVKAVLLTEAVKPIFEKLESDENLDFFYQEIVSEEIEYIKDEYNLSRDDIVDIFDNYGQDYRDRGIVCCVFDDVEDLGREEAASMGAVEEHYEQYFDFKAFGNDLLQDDECYVELSDDRIVKLSYREAKKLLKSI